MYSERDYMRGVDLTAEKLGYAEAPTPKVDVVQTRADFLSRRIEEASGGDSTLAAVEASAVYFTSVEVATPVTASPTRIFPYTIVPLDVRAPTASFVGYNEPGAQGNGMPWTGAPPDLAMAKTPIGTMLIQVGGEVIAQLAFVGAMEVADRAKKHMKHGVAVRGYGGASENKRGATVQPRGKEGAVPDDVDPYNDPDDWSWFQPWTWF